MEDIREKNTILIVENDRPVREALKELVEGMGHEVLTADRVNVALQVLRQEAIDVLLLDLHMPGAHGSEMLEYLRRRNKPVPPTIVVSGNLKIEALPELVRLGVSGIIAKPFNPHRLQEEINRVLGRVTDGVKFCTKCGKALQVEDQFCRSCGVNAVSRQECPSCGEEYDPGDHFCGGCGNKCA